VHHEYTSSKGKPIPLVLYTVEVENLNALAPQLKGAPASLNIKDWENPELIAARLGLPNAEQRLDMLRTGIVPPQANVAWADAENTQVLFHDPLLPRMEAMLGINASTLPGLEQCMHELEMRSYREQSEGVVGGMSCLLAGIEAQLAAIKTHLENTKLIGDGDAPLKMDVLDRPLRAYQEKAMIGAPATFLEHAWQQKKRFTLYDESMWGGRGKENTALSDEERLYTAQMEALTKFLRSVDPMEIGFAASEIKRYKPGKRPKGDVSGLAALADEPPSPWGERVAMPLTARNR